MTKPKNSLICLDDDEVFPRRKDFKKRTMEERKEGEGLF